MNWYFTALRKYGTFGGRARRKEYWMFALINAIICVVLSTVATQMMRGSTRSALIAYVVILAYCLLVLLPGLAVVVRRLHDTDRSGWWLWIQLVPLVGAIVLFVFTVLDGTPGPNQYGPSPKAPNAV